MKLSDIVSAAGLHAYAEVALVLFLLVFIAVSIDLIAKKHADEFAHARLLPLDDDSKSSSPETQTNGR